MPPFYFGKSYPLPFYSVANKGGAKEHSLSLSPYTKFIDYAIRKLFLDAVYESFLDVCVCVYIYIFIASVSTG